MKKKLLLALALAMLIAGAFYAGLSVGNRTTFDWLMGVLETEVRGSLNYHLAALAEIRSGDIEGGTEVLERMVDSAVTSIPQQRSWEELSTADQQALLLAKRYRKIHPSPSSSPDLEDLLEWIPDNPIDVEQCNPALRELLGL